METLFKVEADSDMRMVPADLSSVYKLLSHVPTNVKED